MGKTNVSASDRFAGAAIAAVAAAAKSEKSAPNNNDNKPTSSTTTNGQPFLRGARGRRSSTQLGRLPSMPDYSEPVTFHYEIQHHTSRMQKITKAFAVYRLTFLTIGCVIVGLVLGLVCRIYSNDWSERHFMYVEFPGELYLRLLKLLIIPLLVSNVILSFGSIKGKLSSHLGKLASLLYLMSNCLAIMVAIIFVLLISPGKQMGGPTKSSGISIDNQQQDDIIPPNITPINSNSNEDRIDPYRSKLIPINSNATISKINDTHYEDSWIQPAPIRNNSSSHNSYDKNQQTNTSNVENLITPANFELIRLPTTTTTISDNNNDDHLRSHNNPKRIISQIKQPIIERVVKHITDHHEAASHVEQRPLGSTLPIDVLLDILRNLVPDNIVGIALHQTKTRLLTPQKLIVGLNGSTEPPPSRWPFIRTNIEQANIIGLLACSVLIGVVLSHMGEAGKPLLELCACISELSLRIGMMAVNLTPICIMFLLIGQIARTRDLSSTIGELCMYLVTVMSALIFHGFILMPAIYFAITRNSPLTFLHHQLDVLVASFATSSSSSTLALLLRNLIQFDLNPVIVRAFGPLGSVFNMNGTTMYEVIGCIFLAQKNGVELTADSILLVGLVSAVAGLSTVGIPSSGLMTIVIVMDSINLPVLTLSFIYIVDFIVDRFRTVVNVWTGSIICALIDQLCPESLFDEAKEHNKFLDKWRFKTASKKASVNKNKMSIAGETTEEDKIKSQVISVTITPPLDQNINV